jgi:hypothetical protein
MYSSAPSVRRVPVGHDDALVYPRLIHEADDRFQRIVASDPVYVGARIYDHASVISFNSHRHYSELRNERILSRPAIRFIPNSLLCPTTTAARIVLRKPTRDKLLTLGARLFSFRGGGRRRTDPQEVMQGCCLIKHHLFTAA